MIDAVSPMCYHPTVDLRQIIAKEVQRQSISQRRLAEMSSLTQSRISDYLRGVRDVQGETLVRILDALNLEVTRVRKRRQKAGKGP